MNPVVLDEKNPKASQITFNNKRSEALPVLGTSTLCAVAVGECDNSLQMGVSDSWYCSWCPCGPLNLSPVRIEYQRHWKGRE